MQSLKRAGNLSGDYSSSEILHDDGQIGEKESPVMKKGKPKAGIKKSELKYTQKSNMSYSQLHARSRSGLFSNSSECKNSERRNKSRQSSSKHSPKKQDIVYPAISKDKENLTRLWLKSLNLTVLKAQENHNLLRDPYRNGLLLCEVIKWHIE